MIRAKVIATGKIVTFECYAFRMVDSSLYEILLENCGHDQTGKPYASAIQRQSENYGVQQGEINTNQTIDGDGTVGNRLRIAQQGATNGQVLVWSDTDGDFIPSTPNSGADGNGIYDGDGSIPSIGSTATVTGSGLTIEKPSTTGTDPSLTIKTGTGTAYSGIQFRSNDDEYIGDIHQYNKDALRIIGAPTKKVIIQAGSRDWVFDDGVLNVPPLNVDPTGTSFGDVWFNPNTNASIVGRLKYLDTLGTTRVLATLDDVGSVPDFVGNGYVLYSSGTHTLNVADYMTMFSATGGSVTVDLDAMEEGRDYFFRCHNNATNTVTMTPPSGVSWYFDGEGSLFTGSQVFGGTGGTGIFAANKNYIFRRNGTRLFVK